MNTRIHCFGFESNNQNKVCHTCDSSLVSSSSILVGYYSSIDTRRVVANYG